MRCKIEKRTVVKTKPESRCSRVPREYCRKENCKDEEEQSELMSGDPNCYYRNQIVSRVKYLSDLALASDFSTHKLLFLLRLARIYLVTQFIPI